MLPGVGAIRRPPSPVERRGLLRGSRRWATWSQRVVFVGLLASVLVLGAITAVLDLRYVDHQRAETARGEALAAARSHVGELFSYDYRTYEEDVANAERLLIGPARAAYDEKAAQEQEAVTKDKMVVDAELLSLSVVSDSRPDRALSPSIRFGELTSDPGAAVRLWRDAHPRQVVVLAFVQETTTKGDGKPTVAVSRVRLTMEESDAGWLVAGIDSL